MTSHRRVGTTGRADLPLDGQDGKSEERREMKQRGQAKMEVAHRGGSKRPPTWPTLMVTFLWKSLVSCGFTSSYTRLSSL